MHQGDLTHSDIDLQAKLEKIYALRRTRSKVNWDRDYFLKLLDSFGCPHLSLPPVIHVAGTNGKGSVIAFLHSILEAQGYKVHAYTSPHLIDVNERIVLAGEPINNALLAELIDQALEYVGDTPLSFFEIITAVAFRAFADTPADVLLLEVGLGGRLDCTNVIEAPIATVINRISMDHMDFLGNKLDLIAAEKAGIMKAGVPCLIGAQENAALAVLKKKANEVGAEIVSDWSIDGDMRFTFGGEVYDFPMPSLTGVHQVQNAGLALATLFAVCKMLHVSHEAMSKGLRNVQWPGRLQRLPSAIYGVSENMEIWLDCGHNDSAGAALAAFVRGSDKPVYLVMGMLQTKILDGFLEPLRGLVQGIYVVPLAQDECYTAADIEGAFDCVSVQDAIRVIVQHHKEACILIVGSVYLAGDVLKTLRDLA